MEEGAKLEVKQYLRYKPKPICKVKVCEGSLTKGDYIPSLGFIDKVEDDGEEVECAEARDKPFVITTKVTNDRFKDIDPHIQFKMMLTAMEKLQVWLKAAHNKHGVKEDVEEDEHKEESPIEKFYREYGGGKKFKMTGAERPIPSGMLQ